MECEICGNKGQVTKVEIEGTVLSVCNSCLRLGRKVDITTEIKMKKTNVLEVSSINPEFANIIKKTRNKQGMTVEQLGEKIKEKPSVIERVERGMRPTDALARKLEKALKVKLLNYEEVSVDMNRTKEESAKLGDIAVIKYKKK